MRILIIISALLASSPSFARLDDAVGGDVDASANVILTTAQNIANADFCIASEMLKKEDGDPDRCLNKSMLSSDAFLNERNKVKLKLAENYPCGPGWHKVIAIDPNGTFTMFQHGGKTSPAGLIKSLQGDGYVVAGVTGCKGY